MTHSTTLSIPRDEVRDALVEGFRSGRLPSVPDTLATVFGRAPESVRANLLGVLLKSASPLALSVLAAGRFATYMFRDRWADLPISPEEASQVTVSQIVEIARYAEQADPTLIARLSSVLAADNASLLALGAGVVALLVQFILERRRVAR